MIRKLDDLLPTKLVIDPNDRFDVPVLVCETCGNLGVVNIPGRLSATGDWVSNQLVPCTNPNCPKRAEQQREHSVRLSLQAQLPEEYAALTFDSWEALIVNDPAAMRGKWNAWSAAKAFINAADRNFMFNLTDAAQLADEKLTELRRNPRRRDLYPEPYPNYDALDMGEKNSIVLTGVNGVGKTSLASAITGALLDQHIPALYARTADLLAAIRHTFDKTQKQAAERFDWGETEEAIMTTFQQIPVLLLDEFGISQYTEWNRGMIEQLVRYRYSHHKATIFTTNLGYDEMAHEARWDKATGHAVHGMAHFVQVSGTELRRRNGVWEAR